MSIVLAKRNYDAFAAAAPYIRKYGPTVMKFAARKIQRAYRRRRMVRKGLGFRVGTGVAKRRKVEDTDTAATVASTRTFYWWDMTDLPKTATLDDINARQRDMVNFRGFKICAFIRNDINAPMYLNIAVISPRGAEIRLGTGSGSATTVSDFFRGHGTNRTQDFSNALTALEFRCLPINRDNWRILSHTRHQLGPESNSGTFNVQNRPNYITYEKYFKINRQLRYDNGGECTTPIYWCYWFDNHGVLGGTAPSAAAVATQFHFVSYFREPKN